METVPEVRLYSSRDLPSEWVVFNRDGGPYLVPNVPGGWRQHTRAVNQSVPMSITARSEPAIRGLV